MNTTKRNGTLKGKKKNVKDQSHMPLVRPAVLCSKQLHQDVLSYYTHKTKNVKEENEEILSFFGG